PHSVGDRPKAPVAFVDDPVPARSRPGVDSYDLHGWRVRSGPDGPRAPSFMSELYPPEAPQFDVTHVVTCCDASWTFALSIDASASWNFWMVAASGVCPGLMSMFPTASTIFEYASARTCRSGLM